jgi:hypothetical protein
MKMNQVLGAFGSLDFTMFQPVLTWRAFLNLWIDYLFNFHFFSSCRGKTRILNQLSTGARLYMVSRPWRDADYDWLSICCWCTKKFRNVFCVKSENDFFKYSHFRRSSGWYSRIKNRTWNGYWLDNMICAFRLFVQVLCTLIFTRLAFSLLKHMFHICAEPYVTDHAKFLLLYSFLTQVALCRQIYWLPSLKFHENPSFGYQRFSA